MAFTESDRVQIRHFVGFSAVFLQADPRLENAITAVQSTADGGTRPDNSTELWIKGQITDLQTIESTMKNLWSYAEVGKADEASLDIPRAIAAKRSEGRRLVHGLCRMLSLKGPRADVFSPTPPNPQGSAFLDVEDSAGSHW